MWQELPPPNTNRAGFADGRHAKLRGGSFAVRFPGISGAMVQDKAAFIEQANVGTVVATDAGCLMNIAGCLRRRGSAVRVLHLAELLEKT